MKKKIASLIVALITVFCACGCSVNSSDTAVEGAVYIAYYNDFAVDEVDVNGNITQWDYGFFKVYWWSNEGLLLGQCPEYIVIDDETYAFTSSWEAEDEYTWEIIEKYRANNGVAIEICSVNENDGKTDTILHYEPVSGDGYTEGIGESYVLDNIEYTTEADLLSEDADVWYVPYYIAYDEPSADENGLVSMWDYGYFTAHRWSKNGKKIASMPEYVVVDGVVYQYVSHWYSNYKSATCHTWKVINKCRANGGIAFQTCTQEQNYDGGIIIVHYEPVFSDGYTEHIGETAVLTLF